MKPLTQLIISYIILLNLLSFFAMGIDKRKAIKNQWRIPEGSLFLLGFFGGSIGLFSGMKVFHHKTKKPRFQYGVPAILLLNILFITFLFQF
jgi:uncharacterized membrane protein YsdA (DUF1294 family)